jgi:hypothetical protein
MTKSVNVIRPFFSKLDFCTKNGDVQLGGGSAASQNWALQFEGALAI